MEKREGSILDFLGVGITLLAMSVVMTTYLNCTELLITKAQVGQLARRYILRMETVGCLTEGDRQELMAELDRLGMRNTDLSGTTVEPVGYGETLVLRIRGTISVEMPESQTSLWERGFSAKSYAVEELRMSTAKN